MELTGWRDNWVREKEKNLSQRGNFSLSKLYTLIPGSHKKLEEEKNIV